MALPLSETLAHKAFKSYSCDPLDISIEPVFQLTVPPTPASVPYCSASWIFLPIVGVTFLCVKFVLSAPEPVSCPCKDNILSFILNYLS